MAWFNKEEKKPVVELKMEMHEVHVNPGSTTQRRRNQARIATLKVALEQPKHKGDKAMLNELARRELYEQAAKLGEEE
jgi:hypothetical protein